MGLVGWIILGGLAGWIASALMKEREGCLMNVIIGIGGALLGGFLFSLTGIHTIFRLDLWSLFVAVIGSIVLLAIVNLLRRRA